MNNGDDLSAHELHHASLIPARVWANATMDLYGSPFSPFAGHPVARMLLASADLLLRTTHRYLKPDSGLSMTSVDGKVVGVTEEKALEKPFCTLVHFRRDTTAKQPKVLSWRRSPGTTPPCCATRCAQCFRTTTSTSRTGSMPAWCRSEGGNFHLHDYVGLRIEFIRHLGPDIHLVSVCQPTVPVLAAISIMATDERSGAGAQHDHDGRPHRSRRSPTAVNDLATSKPFPGSSGRSYTGFRAVIPGPGAASVRASCSTAGFVTMNPDRHAQSHWDYST